MRGTAIKMTQSLKLRLLIAALFFLSGCAALIYEVVWFQLLKFTIGSSSISLGITVSTFMGGMCLGSLLYHRVVGRRHNPLKVYAYLELGIGIWALLTLYLLPLMGGLYFQFAGYGPTGLVMRSIVAALFLLPPTMLMGATLPAIARWVKADREGLAFLGIFYSTNILGAVLGTILAGFILLRLFDTHVATYVAFIINIAVAGVALALSKSRNEVEQSEDLSGGPVHEAGNAKFLYLIAALSGFTALGCQVLWTRLLAEYYGGTVYSFSIILAVFLVGLGVGSSLGSVASRRVKSPLALLFFLQIFLGLAIWWSGYSINSLIHRIFLFGITPDYIGTDPLFIAKSMNDLVRTVVTILPATLIWGSIFPLSLSVVTQNQEDPSRASGRLYAANTLGAVFGALCMTLVTIPVLGTEISQQIVAAATVFGAAVALVALPKPLNWNINALIGAFGVSFVALVLVFFPTPINQNMSLLGRLQSYWDRYELLAFEQGVNSTVGVTDFERSGQFFRRLHVSGKVVASSFPEDMRLQRLLAHLPAMFQEEPKSALIIGFGAGVTAGTFTLYDSIERIVIVEIEPRVPLLSGEYFREHNYDVLNDPRVELIIDDGRHYLATTDEKFDIITTDPIHPWVKGAASLYSREFYELVKAHLTPQGFVSQWAPFYETEEAAVKSQIATFFEAFPHSSVWNTYTEGQGYDATLLGYNMPPEISERSLITAMTRTPKLAQSFRELDLQNPALLLFHYGGQESDMTEWLADAEINRDRNLRLEYLAGASINSQKASEISENMLSNITYPEDLFSLQPNSRAVLREYFRTLRELE